MRNKLHTSRLQESALVQMQPMHSIAGPISIVCYLPELPNCITRKRAVDIEGRAITDYFDPNRLTPESLDIADLVDSHASG